MQWKKSRDCFIENKHFAQGEILIKAGDLDRIAYYPGGGDFQSDPGVAGAGEEVYSIRSGEWIGEIALILKSTKNSHSSCH